MAKIYGALERAQIETLASDPAGANLVTGRVWFNSSSSQVKYYDGSSVQVIGTLAASADSVAAAMTSTGTTSISGTMTSANADTIASKMTVNTYLASAKSADYTVTDSDKIHTVLMTAGGADKTVTLPAAANNNSRIICIKKVDSGVGKVIVDGNASETIDGALTKNIRQQYESITVHCDGSNWHILDRQGLVTPFVSYTPTGSFNTNCTYTGKWRRVGDKMEIYANIAFSGAPNSASNPTLSIPSGFTIDTSKLPGSSLTDRTVGQMTLLDNGINAYSAECIYGSTTTVVAQSRNASGTYLIKSTASETAPFTIGNGDQFIFEISVPIVEFDF